jgi:hypothetical protein
MWTGRYRKRNAMYTVFPKYVRFDVTRSVVRGFLARALHFGSPKKKKC